MRTIAVSVFCLLAASGCATKWSDAPEAVYPGENFKSAVQWLPAPDSGFDILATPKTTPCCFLAQDEIRLPLVEAARRKESELCAGLRPVVDSDSYDATYQIYSARVGCRKAAAE